MKKFFKLINNNCNNYFEKFKFNYSNQFLNKIIEEFNEKNLIQIKLNNNNNNIVLKGNQSSFENNFFFIYDNEKKHEYTILVNDNLEILEISHDSEISKKEIKKENNGIKCPIFFSHDNNHFKLKYDHNTMNFFLNKSLFKIEKNFTLCYEKEVNYLFYLFPKFNKIKKNQLAVVIYTYDIYGNYSIAFGYLNYKKNYFHSIENISRDYPPIISIKSENSLLWVMYGPIFKTLTFPEKIYPTYSSANIWTIFDVGLTLKKKELTSIF